ncbi:amidohydrolase family protein [Arthrobacter wenxiniae]|jgi:L-fuconolactonase|uniref:Amidohydrolase family protein n=1 Tax=Arthrobacter wenxiniae TaxID=2713570 RepID=A0A7Y7M0D6_9MICC|nr:amidohydrolase family protein [Arthrobacter wenxiniae]NVM95621.1 amidohydrolase family protein [Arthrobacter wenxiniae]
MADEAAEGAVERLDAHLHLWELGEGRYPWLGPQHGQLFRNYDAGEARQALAAAGVQRAILVQADDTPADTVAMLRHAAGHDWIAGVVGWLPLEDPRAAAALLDQWREHPKFCGVRTLVHDDPRPDVLELPAVRESLGLLAAAGIPFDVPDAFPRHLGQVAALAAELPGLTVVVDHLGKPPRAGSAADMDRWERQLRAVAALPNTAAKVSGLHCNGAAFDPEALARVWTAALEAFGPDRLMFGGDWPVSLPGAGYGRTVQVAGALIGSLSHAEAAAIWAGTARRVYGQ